MNKQQISLEMEMAYTRFKDDFDLRYNLPDISPSLIKLCFCKGYERGLKDMYNTLADVIVPESDMQRL
jgi:hypothetical protein